MQKQARFWRYTGNHPDGKDHIRYNPHNFDIDLISLMSYWGEGDDYIQPLTFEDVNKIKVIHHKGDNFGHEVTVRAPSEVWEKGKKAYEYYAKMIYFGVY